MFAVEEPELLHEIRFRTSGSSGPRDLRLQLFTVRYRTPCKNAPTFVTTADLQGRETGKQNRLLGELLAEEIGALQQLDALPFFDLCLLCGDFYDYPDLRKLGGTGDVTSAFDAMSQTATQTLAVLGNHDKVDLGRLTPKVRILDGDVVTTDSFTVGGVSGIIGSPNRNNRKTEDDFLSAIDQCSTSRTDLLLLHQGPQGTNAEARGIDAINVRLKRRSNLLVIFGHCHWPIPFQSEGQNLFCNVDGRVLAFIPDQNVSSQKTKK